MIKNIKTQLVLFFRFLKLLLPYRAKWFAILALSTTGAMLGLINPYLSKLVIDKGIVSKDLKAFVFFVFLGVLVFILSSATDGIRQFLDRHIGYKVNFNLNKKVFKHLQNLSCSYFTGKSSGEHIYRINYDIDRVSEFITAAPPQAVSIFPSLVATLCIVCYINWKMALLSLILTPFLYLPILYFAKIMRKVWKDLIEHYEDIFKNLQEIFSHIQLIKAFGKESSSVNRYLKALIANIRIRRKNIKLEIFSSFSSNTVNRILLGTITFYGGYQVIKGEMTLGSLIAIMAYLGQLMGLQHSFANFFRTIALGLVSCQRVADILDTKQTVRESSHAKDARFSKGEIVFENVSFGYDIKRPVIKNLNLTIKGQSHIAFSGASGCGKTTVLNLILRLYDPWQGEILIDSYRIKELKFCSLKEQIGVALQEPFLLNDSIENNIRYAKEDASKEELIRIARICGVDDLAQNLPKGYETIIGENACKISEGQKQRIALARALIKRPKILIIDESFSSIDSQSEEQIMRNIKEHYKNMTMIVISHRPSTIDMADLVYSFSQEYGIIISKR
jgi:ABC-type bacteriocin/lantibiotic exporter with double-glycine peptidase domain